MVLLTADHGANLIFKPNGGIAVTPWTGAGASISRPPRVADYVPSTVD